MKKFIRTLKHYSAYLKIQNIAELLALIAVAIVFVRRLFGYSSTESEITYLLILLSLIVVNQLVERIRNLPHIEQVLITLGFARTLGLLGSYTSRQKIKQEILDTVLKAEQIDLLGVAHNELFFESSFYTPILQDVRHRRKRLRLILLWPQSSEAARREVEEKEPSVKQCIELHLNRIETTINPGRPEPDDPPPVSLDEIVHFYDYAPSCMIIRADEIMYVVNYVYGKFGIDSPAQTLIKTPGGLFEVYEEHFQKTWGQEKTKKFSDWKKQASSNEKTATSL